MISRCFACDHALGQNTELEWLPAADSVAFDAGRGRLWVICRWCSHWSLVPMEERWEAVEELERRTARAPVLAATEAVALVQVGSVRALRVGRAPAREEAWWRYGPGLRGRRRRFAYVSGIGGTLAAGAAVSGLAVLALVPGMIEIAAFGHVKVGRAPGAARRMGAEIAADFDRRFRYGRYAWHGSAGCAECGGLLHRLQYRELELATLREDGSVLVRCAQCARGAGGYAIPEPQARDLVRRCLSYVNIEGATQDELNTAVELIRSGVVRTASYSGPLSFGSMSRPQAVALELTATERVEAVMLGLEMRDLAARWRSAEAIAAIVDRELT
jgi:hypothetical protein